MPLSSSEIESGFLDAMRRHGVEPVRALNLIADGVIHRYRAAGDKPGSKNGWYVLYDDGAMPGGAFGSWKTGVSGTWSAKSENTMTAAERDAWRRRMQEAQEARERELKKLRMEAREKAERLWKLAQPARAGRANDGAPEGHPYLIAKGVKPYGLRILKKSLVVPVRNSGGNLMSLQFIGPDGSKRFLTGGEIAGGYCAIGNPEGTLCIAEGFATAASIREATGFAVAVAFNAGNLTPVAKALREKFPALRIVICADNDQLTEGNPGLTRAQEASDVSEGLAIAPIFEPHELDSKPTDFNDLHRLRGLEGLRAFILSAMDNVVPISAPRTRRDLDQLIDGTEDFDQLTEAIAAQVNQSGLGKAAKEYLLSKIARKAGVPKSSLVLVGGDSGGGRKPKKDDDGDELIAQLNDKHAVLPVGGRILILNREYDPVMDRPFMTFSDRTNFENRYCNRKVWHQGEDVPLGKYWMEHPERLQYDGMIFLPAGEVPGYLNLWQGWGVEPLAGSCRLFLDFLSDVICDGCDVLFSYVLDWCAHLAQRPAELPEVALVLRGREGIGKNTFVDMLMRIVGKAHSLLLSSLNQVTGRFSGHLANALLVFCNESVWGGDKQAQGVLKSMITDETQPIEHKGQDLVMVRSFRRMIFATNEHWAVPRGHDDRRYVIADVSHARKGDWEFFRAIRREMDAGGAAAFFELLLERDIGGWHPRQVPGCLLERGWELKIESGGTVVKWWFDVLQRGWLIKAEESYAEDAKYHWPEHLPVEQVQKLYLRWCDDYRITHREHIVYISKLLHEYGVRTGRPGPRNEKRRRSFLFPDLETARRAFSKRLSIPDSAWKDDAVAEGEDS